LLLELRAFRVGAVRAERPRRSDLGEVHAKVRGAADTHADDGRRAGLAAGLEHAIDDESFDRVDALGGHRHAQPRVALRSRALRAGIGLVAREPLEALLDVGRELFQRADIERLRCLLDLVQINLHLTSILRSRTTFAHSAVSSLIARANSSGVLPTGESPCT